MPDEYPTVRVAAVQAASVFLDRDGCVDKACSLIREASEKGARLIAFPESFIPGHPLWYHFHGATSGTSLRLAAELQKNAVIVPSGAVKALCEAARKADAYVVIGICEKESSSAATLYNSQLFIDRHGEVLGVHRKLTPTLGERLVHTGGFGDSLRCFASDFGFVSGLICGENSNPLAISALTSMGVGILVASWPPHFSRSTHKMSDVIDMTARFSSYSGGCAVVSAAGVVDDQLRGLLAVSDEDRAFFEAGAGGGGSVIMGPRTQILAGPTAANESIIIYADIEMEQTIQARLIHDYAGHYNRRDVFSLHVNRSAPDLVYIHESHDSSSPVWEDYLPSSTEGLESAEEASGK